MKELVLSPVVKKLDDFLRNFPRQEGSVSKEGRKVLLSLRNSLEQLKLSPKKSEGGGKKDNEVYSTCAEYGYKVEDFIDKLAVAIESLRSTTKVIYGGSIRHTGSQFLKHLSNVASIQIMVPDVQKLRQELSRIQNETGPVLGEERSRSTVPEKPFPSEFCNLEPQSLLPSSDIPDRLLIVVVGMGGLGKTYLVQKTLAHQNYDDRSNRLYASVHVSKDYEIPNLLRKVIKDFKMDSALQNEELDMMETEELGLYLYESLAERSYVVVLDEVWDSEVWAYLRRALPNNKLGSRVFITTRVRSSIYESGIERTQVYEHPGADQSYKYFLQFGKPWHEIPEPKNRLISQCNGLFVALICVGKLLWGEKATKDSRHFWELCEPLSKDWDEASRDSRLFWELLCSSFLPEISSILDLSFDDLHHHLKLCYLYLALFPENFEIKVDKLVRLWIAEGFIKSGKGGTLEEVAMDYVNELADRSLIQIEKRNATRISTFLVHPCLRALLLKKSEELKLFHVFEDKKISHAVPARLRRVASHCGFGKNFTTNDKTRTVMVFTEETNTVVKLSKVDFFNTHLLQVLDLEGTWFSASLETGKTTLPDVVGELFLLRYLGLNDTYIDDLPPSIKTLRALQTLYVDRDILVSIPNEINELKRLRHLLGRLKWPFKVKNLSDLQTLGCIEVVDRLKFNTWGWPKLRELYVDLNYGWRSDLEPIGRLKTLQSLSLKLYGGVDLLPLSKCRDLLQLKLKGEIGTLPDNMHEIFPNLRYLYIYSLNYHLQFHLWKLAKLQKLTILDLYRCNISANEFNEDETFPQLEILQLIECRFKDLTFSDTTMPLLKELLITPENKNISHRLMRLPAPKNWRLPKEDDWPYYPRTMP